MMGILSCIKHSLAFDWLRVRHMTKNIWPIFRKYYMRVLFGLLFWSWKKNVFFFFFNWINFLFSNLNLMKIIFFNFFKNIFLKQDIKQIYYAFYSRYWLNCGPRWLQKYHLLRRCAPQQIVLLESPLAHSFNQNLSRQCIIVYYMQMQKRVTKRDIITTIRFERERYDGGESYELPLE